METHSVVDDELMTFAQYFSHENLLSRANSRLWSIRKMFEFIFLSLSDFQSFSDPTRLNFALYENIDISLIQQKHSIPSIASLLRQRQKTLRMFQFQIISENNICADFDDCHVLCISRDSRDILIFYFIHYFLLTVNGQIDLWTLSEPTQKALERQRAKNIENSFNNFQYLSFIHRYWLHEML